MRPLGRTLTLLGLVTTLGVAPVAASAASRTAHPAPRTAHPVAKKAPAKVWKSGVFTASSVTGDAVKAWAAYRGRAVDVASAYVGWDRWDQVAHDTWPERAFASLPTTRLSVGVPLLPRQNPGTLADVAAGRHDAEFASFARNLVNGGRANAIVRLGWEFDGDWVPWAATDPATYKAAFRHVVGVIRSVAPRVKIDWCGNNGGTHVGHDEFSELYPGDDVVDIVGVDAYNRQWYPVKDAASWKSFVTMSHGLNAWYSFAVKHGKKLSVPEWGLYSTEAGDNAFYVQKMHTWFANHAGQLAYESYFNDSASYIANSLTGPDQNPRASATYASLW